MMTATLFPRFGFGSRRALRRAVYLGLTLGVAVLSSRAQQNATPQPVLVADFNHDGIPDALVLSTTSPTATIAFGTVPYGTFSAISKVVPFPAGCTSLPQGSVLAGDFNGDGLADIAFFCGIEVSGVMLGNGDGTFGTPKYIFGIESSLAALGDFNHDGKLDIAAVGSNGIDGTSASIIFFAGKGDGTFSTAVQTPYAANTVYTAVAIADVNGDGYPDVVAANFTPTRTSSVDVFGYNQDGTFGTAAQNINTPNATVILTAAAASSILEGNFFGAGAADFVVPGTGANPSLFAIRNTSSGGAYSLAAPVAISSPGLLNASAGNFTGGVTSDLLIANGTTLSVLANDGTGNFTAAYSTLNVPFTASLFAIADANGDGYTDVYSATSNAGALLLGVNVVTGAATATSQPFSLGPGTKAVSATWNGNVNFLGATATGSQIVTGATTLVWNPPASIVYGTPLSATQLNATAVDANGVAIPGTFAYTPAQGTVLDAGVSTLSVTFTPTDPLSFLPATQTVSLTVTQASPVVSWATPASIAYGVPLSAAQLNATATGVGAGALPGSFTYTPAAGTVLNPGSQTLSVAFAPTNAVDYSSAVGTVNVLVTGVTVASFTPSTVALDAPATTITLTGAGFVATSVVQVNGTAIATTLVNATTLTALVPASYFTKLGTLQITVADPGVSSVSPALTLTVAGPSVGATVTAPPTTAPGSQASVVVALTQSYPIDVTGTLTLGFIRSATPQLTDPSLQLVCQDATENCSVNATGTTLTFTVPANTTTAPVILLQAGTIAGTISVPLTLTAGGLNVTPADLAPATIVVPPAAPTISGMTVTRAVDQLTVVIHGFSNTREVVKARFHFTAAPGATIGTPDLTLPADAIFNIKWFDTDPSNAYGSTFTYTQIFNTSDVAANIGSIDATLTNTVGASNVATAK